MEMVKYLRYVFNDFFVIALMFFIGALSLSYSNLLRNLQTNLWWEPLLVIIVILFSVHLGTMVTLIKQPDQVFLTPKEYDFKSYFQAALKYSYLMASLIQFLVWFILLPFMSISFGWKTLYLVFVLILMLLIKFYLLEIEFLQIRRSHPSPLLRKMLFNWIIPIGILGIAFYIGLPTALFLTLVCIFGVTYEKLHQFNVVNWQYVINTEDKRMNRVYRFFSLFTDVPSLPSKLHRRKYLDPLLKPLKKDQKHLFSNLYLRTFIRDNDTSSLYFRLLLVGFVLLVFVNNQILAILISVLFIYLTGIQIIPFFNYFDDNVLIHIYPVNEKIKVKNFRKLLQLLLMIEMLLLLIGMLIAKDSLQTILISIVLWLIEIYFLTVTLLNKKNKN
ncbi:hypothetical protein IV52_GL000515 [Fructilactobacillus lindneri DSM 20690 = JCM 11027]|uniref:ABC transporter permease n=2 Tax=Fructilactobacillus lindneri TaxID=53444 RepID=A0A0R2JTG4_9LACO|nr:ABC transporter permease [Fructilactobacillus lindneri]KRN79110.1 hypothetical protein IV52_GL000515 [Fructilactobacillus lindneri DSM 20690 = JCM 11027]